MFIFFTLSFFILIMTLHLGGRKTSITDGTVTNIQDISRDIEIKKFPSGKYKYIFFRNFLTREYSLELYGNVKQSDIKDFCLINSYYLRDLDVGCITINVPEKLHKEKKLYFTSLYNVTGRKNAVTIEMYVSKTDGKFYAKITGFL